MIIQTLYWQRSYYKRIYYKKTPWTQPTLTANGTAGGDSFAVSASAEGTGTQFHPAYNAFDNNSSTYWRSGTTTGWIQFYNPVPLLAQSIRWIYFYCYPTGGTVEGSNDGGTWKAVSTWTNSIAGDFDIQVGSDAAYRYYRVNITGVNKDVIHSSQLNITAEEIAEGAADDYDYYVDETATEDDYDYYVDKRVNEWDDWNVTTETEILGLRNGANLRYGLYHCGKYGWAAMVEKGGGDNPDPDASVNYLPNAYAIIAYRSDGTKTAIFGAGSESNNIESLKFELIETGCGSFEIIFKSLPDNSELDYRQRIDIHLFNDPRPWYSGYVITRPVKGTTDTTFKFTGHGYYNILEKVYITAVYENMEVSAVVAQIVRQVERAVGLQFNGNKLIDTSYRITRIEFDHVSVKDALKQLSDFAVDYVYGVDEYRQMYFKPRVNEINEQARFWVGQHLDEYQPTWDVEKVINRAYIKGGKVDDAGEQWLATVEDVASQEEYGLQETVLTLPSAYNASDAARWGLNQIERNKEPVKSAKVKGVKLEYPRPDGTFFVRKLSTDGQAAITTIDGDLHIYPINKLKYTVSAATGIKLDTFELGQQPFAIDKYFADLDRNAKNNELLQQASTKQLKLGG